MYVICMLSYRFHTKIVFFKFGRFLVGTRPRECQKRIPRKKLCRIDKISAQTAVWETISWPKCVLRPEFEIFLDLGNFLGKKNWTELIIHPPQSREVEVYYLPLFNTPRSPLCAGGLHCLVPPPLRL